MELPRLRLNNSKVLKRKDADNVTYEFLKKMKIILNVGDDSIIVSDSRTVNTKSKIGIDIHAFNGDYKDNLVQNKNKTYLDKLDLVKKRARTASQEDIETKSALYTLCDIMSVDIVDLQYNSMTVIFKEYLIEVNVGELDWLKNTIALSRREYLYNIALCSKIGAVFSFQKGFRLKESTDYTYNYEAFKRVLSENECILEYLILLNKNRLTLPLIEDISIINDNLSLFPNPIIIDDGIKLHKGYFFSIL